MTSNSEAAFNTIFSYLGRGAVGRGGSERRLATTARLSAHTNWWWAAFAQPVDDVADTGTLLMTWWAALTQPGEL